MNAPALLVDSNVYIDLLRRGIDPSIALLEYFDTLSLATCGMVQLEVLRGVKPPRLQDRLRQFFSVMLYVPADEKLWRAATRLAWELDRRGQVIPGPDALIAASALQLGADVVTADGHFDAIPGLRVRPPPPGLG
jgi:predicted nucleic acid-binding protein